MKITSSSSLTCEAFGESALVYTFAEDEKCSVRIRAEEGISYGLALILSEEHGASLMAENGMLVRRISFLGMRDETIIPLHDRESFSFSKEGDRLIFLNGDETVSSFQLASIRQSVSVGIVMRGKGRVSLSF